MKATDEYLRILRGKKEYLMAKYPIARMALFGSVARREQEETSDVDICYESDSIRIGGFAGLSGRLASYGETDRRNFSRKDYKKRYDLCMMRMLYIGS